MIGHCQGKQVEPDSRPNQPLLSGEKREQNQSRLVQAGQVDDSIKLWLDSAARSHGIRPSWVWAHCAQAETSWRWTDSTISRVPFSGRPQVVASGACLTGVIWRTVEPQCISGLNVLCYGGDTD